MSFTDENILPGIEVSFGTNAETNDQLKEIEKALSTLEHVEKIVLKPEVFPKEFSIKTNAVLSIDSVQKKVIEVGYHAIPKEGLSI